MRVLLLSLLLVSLFAAVPAAASFDANAPDEPCQRPWVEAYACFWGSTGVQHLTVCGKEIGTFCMPID